MQLAESRKINEFAMAIEKYNTNLFYNKFGLVVSSVVMVLQVITLGYLLSDISEFGNLSGVLVALVLSYITTDFVNGLIHMYMDNNTNYTSKVGPFVAAFHRHHYKPRYTDRSVLQIYFYESGSKFWLPVYLVVLWFLQSNNILPFSINLYLTSFGIFSCVAEVSHYLCHNSRKEDKIVTFLQKSGILLSKKHHSHHHAKDNTNYAFLNGISDPLINKIAAALYEGYKGNADVHVLAYNRGQTDNRG